MPSTSTKKPLRASVETDMTTAPKLPEGLEPEHGDDWEDEPVCARCHGDGMDPWNDYLLDCPECQGRQQP